MLAPRRLGYPREGWISIFESLVSAVRSHGHVSTRNPVREIVISGHRAVKVVTSRTTYESRAVLCTLPFQQVSEILDLKYLSSGNREYTRRVEPTSGISIDFGLHRRISDMDGVIFTMEPPTMGCFTSNVEAALAPEGKQLGTWFMILPWQRMSDRGFVKSRLRVLRTLVARMFPGIWDLAEWDRSLVMDMVDGAVPTVGQARPDRPGFDSSIENLFFAGDGTCGRGQGGDIAFDSALGASRLIESFLVRSRMPGPSGNAR